MKEAKSSLIKNIRHQAKKQGGQVFYSGNVIKHHIKSKGKDERILIITHLFISYYSKKGENTNTNYWTDLKGISFQKKTKNLLLLINLTFDQNEVMTFECPQNSKVDLIILESVKYMSSGQDIKIEGIEIPINFSILPRSIFNIFMSQIYINNNSLQKPLKSSIRMICRLQSKIVGFLPDMVDQYFPFLLNAIANSNYVESFRIPELPNTDVYSSLSKYLKSDKYEYSSIIHLQISKQEMRSFQNFCEALSKEKSVKNRISGLTFCNNEFNQDQLKSLSEAIINSKWNNGYEINSIKFENAVKDDVNFADSFFPNLASITSANSPLKLFSLSRMKIGDVSQFISLLKGVRVLALSYMGIEINSIFEAISNTGMEELMFLNVSGNFLNETVNSVKKLPSSLQRLDVNEVNFLVKNPNSEKGNMLIDFFVSVLNKKWNTLFYLSISHVFCHSNEGGFPPEQVLQKLFSKLKKLKNSECEILRGLSFSANFINDDFFEFVKKCKNLRSLYLDFCLYNESPCLKSFCNALKTSLPNLNALSIRGDIVQNRVLGENFITVCKAIKKLKSLQCLIVADNLIGTKGLEALSKLFDPTTDAEKDEAANEDNQNKPNEEEDNNDNDDESNKKKKTKKKPTNNSNNNSDTKNYVYDTLNSISFDNCNASTLMPIIGVAAKAANLGRPIAIDYPTQEVWRLSQAQITDKPQIKELRETIEFCLKGNKKSEISKTKTDDEFKPIFEYWKKPFAECKVPANDFFPEYLSPEVLAEINSPEKARIEPDQSESKDNESEKKTKTEPKKKDVLEDSDSDSDSDSDNDKNKKKDANSDEDEEDDDEYEISSDSDSSEEPKNKKKIQNDGNNEENGNDESNKKKKNKSSKKKNPLESESEEEESDEDQAWAKKHKKNSKKKQKFDSESEEEDEDLRNKKHRKNSKKKQKFDSESEEEDEDLRNKKHRKSSKKKQKFDSASEEEDEELRNKKHRKNSKKKQKFDSASEEEEDDLRSKKHRKSSKKKQKFDSESEEEEGNLRNKKHRKSLKKKQKFDSGSEEEDDDDEINKRRKRSKRSSKKKQKFDSDSEEEDSIENDKAFKKRKVRNNERKKFYDSEDDDRLQNSRKKRKRPSNLRDPYSEDNESDDDDFDQGNKWKMTSQKTKRTNLDSDSDESGKSPKHKNSNRSKRSSRKRDINSDSDFDDSIESDSNLKQSSKNHKKKLKRDDDEYGDSDENQSFPLSIDSKKEKKMIHNLKKKFSINHLQEEIINVVSNE